MIFFHRQTKLESSKNILHRYPWSVEIILTLKTKLFDKNCEESNANLAPLIRNTLENGSKFAYKTGVSLPTINVYVCMLRRGRSSNDFFHPYKPVLWVNHSSGDADIYVCIEEEMTNRCEVRPWVWYRYIASFFA